MEAQHVAVSSGNENALEAAERFGKSGSTEDGEALASACRSLLDEVEVHLTEEEEEVVPIVSRTVTPEEWGALPAHVLSHARAQLLSHAPPPVSEMWFGFGSEAFSKEMDTIRAYGS